ncbi:MAG: phospho-N-acetylmuramoyl-pentapeptide-transferase [Lachnospiraceae bacterium]|nr:phospho-N-acetylmuramoyl-pentapeptide-transferase [Lachnospiraceae bacterium]
MFISIDTILAALIAFALTAVICPVLIPFLIRLKVGQTERKEGVQSHLKKAGTPTMGGIAILVSVLVTSLIFARRYPRILPVLFLTLGFGIIGFVDDYLKVVLRRSDGLLPKQKMAGQIVVTAIFMVYVWLRDPACLDWRIPFTGGMIIGNLAFRIFSTLAAFVVIIGTVNGVNFTDGLDGLASSVTSAVAVFFCLASMTLTGQIEPICAAMFGALLGFLLFNVHPAKVFMGDIGSLALGGFVAGAAYSLQMPVYIVIVGLIYLVEVLSVMIQVTYFKKTGGKRIFRMAPIHHHFELGGWSETRVVAVFTIITILLCLTAFIRIV